MERALSKLRPNPKNPRRSSHDEGFDELVASIKAQGVLQPLLITQDGMILAGHRRYEAAKSAGLDTVPVHIANDEARSGDHDFVCLIENLLRSDLEMLEVAEYMRFCETEYGFDAKGISEMTGIRIETVKNYLKVATAPAEIKEALKTDRMGITSALELLRCQKPETVAAILAQPDLSREAVRRHRARIEKSSTPSLRMMLEQIEAMDELLDYPEYRAIQSLLRQVANKMIDAIAQRRRTKAA